MNLHAVHQGLQAGDVIADVVISQSFCAIKEEKEFKTRIQKLKHFQIFNAEIKNTMWLMINGGLKCYV